MRRTQRPYDFPRSRGEVVSRMERLGARSKTAYRESGTNRFNPTAITPDKCDLRANLLPRDKFASCFLQTNISGTPMNRNATVIFFLIGIAAAALWLCAAFGHWGPPLKNGLAGAGVPSR